MPLTKSQARAYRKRWKVVNDHEARELRTMSMDVKWRQLNTLMRWAQAFGWTEVLSEGIDEVRARWAKLKKAYREQKEKGET